MSDVIDIQKAREERTPRLTGEAKCLACGDRWVAVVPVGTTWMECGKCGLWRGRMIGQVERPEEHWHCRCDSDLFAITPTATYCPNCGMEQVFPWS